MANWTWVPGPSLLLNPVRATCTQTSCFSCPVFIPNIPTWLSSLLIRQDCLTVTHNTTRHLSISWHSHLSFILSLWYCVEHKEIKTFRTLRNGFHGHHASDVNLHMRGTLVGCDWNTRNHGNSLCLQGPKSMRVPPCKVHWSWTPYTMLSLTENITDGAQRAKDWPDPRSHWLGTDAQPSVSPVNSVCLGDAKTFAHKTLLPLSMCCVLTCVGTQLVILRMLLSINPALWNDTNTSKGVTSVATILLSTDIVTYNKKYTYLMFVSISGIELLKPLKLPKW